MKKIMTILLIFVGLSTNAAMYKEKPLYWSLIGGLGWTDFQTQVGASGQTIFKRIGISRDFLRLDSSRFGENTFALEFAAQDGNEMQPAVSAVDSANFGGAAINATVKPIFDLLVSDTHPLGMEVSGVLKAGIAYRQMQFDDNSINGLNRVNGEIQAGFSVKVAKKSSVAIVYQGIYARKMDFTVTNIGLNPIGSFGAIPTQQGILLTYAIHG